MFVTRTFPVIQQKIFERAPFWFFFFQFSTRKKVTEDFPEIIRASLRHPVAAKIRESENIPK